MRFVPLVKICVLKVADRCCSVLSPVDTTAHEFDEIAVSYFILNSNRKFFTAASDNPRLSHFFGLLVGNVTSFVLEP